VVEIAGGHHEKMDGTGYPRRLRREQMSLPARMMAFNGSSCHMCDE
jgi:HD-GYP domain-containing protein (c-di-GMP phosphodiesterase class II)